MAPEDAAPEDAAPGVAEMAAVGDVDGLARPPTKTLLWAANPHERDPGVTFDPERHVYEVTLPCGSKQQVGDPLTDGKRTMSGLGVDYLSKFDASAVVEANFAKWATDSENKYFAMISAALDPVMSGIADGTAKKWTERAPQDFCREYAQLVRTADGETGGETGDAYAANAKLYVLWQWWQNRERSSGQGTAVHAMLERVCNGHRLSELPREDRDHLDIAAALVRCLNSEFEPEKKWTPYRTEQPLYYEVGGDSGTAEDAVLVVTAGTPDLILKSEVTGEYALVDFKCVAPKKINGVEGDDGMLRPEYGRVPWAVKSASAPLDCFEDTKYGKYELQLNVLAHVLKTRYGIDVGDRMYLFQVYPGIANVHCQRVASYQSAVVQLLKAEAARIAAAANGAAANGAAANGAAANGAAGEEAAGEEDEAKGAKRQKVAGDEHSEKPEENPEAASQTMQAMHATVEDELAREV